MNIKPVTFGEFATAFSKTGANWSKTAELLDMSPLGLKNKFAGTFDIRIKKRKKRTKEKRFSFL